MDDDTFRFEKLGVPHAAVARIQQVYAASRSFLETERFGLQSQLRRSAVSVASNISEATGRRTDADFIRFLEMA